MSKIQESGCQSSDSLDVFVFGMTAKLSLGAKANIFDPAPDLPHFVNKWSEKFNDR
jgi:hypothetical protein